MLRLIVLTGPDVGREADLTHGGLVGRSEAASLRLRDRSISREHARIDQRGASWFLVDQNSTNGLWVGLERVSEAELADFGEVRVGEVTLRARFESDQPESKVTTAAPRQEPIQFQSGGGATVVEDEGADLELEWDLEESAPGTAADPGGQASSAPKATTRDLQREELLRSLQTKRAGLLSADLSQLPSWMRGLLFLGALLVAVGVFYGVMQVVVMGRAG